VPWTTLASGKSTVDRSGMTTARMLAQVGLAALILITLVGAGGVVVSRRTAEREAVNGAAQATDLLADAVLQPALLDGIVSSEADAVARVDTAVRQRVLNHAIRRVKLWTPQGRIVYSDDARLIGRTFPLGAEEAESLTAASIHAEVTDVSRPENQFERGQGKLLEVYRPVWTPSGRALLFETYTPYTAVSKRTTQLWRGFAGIVISSLLLLVVLLLPVLWALLDRLRRAQRQRESMLQHAVDASTQERQRIAGNLHDGVVQELVATSFTVTAAAEHAATLGQTQLAARLRTASGAVRGSIGGLRSLLVDIYPPSLRSAGLVAALNDLVGTMRSRDIDVRLDVAGSSSPTGLSPAGEQLVFRVAQECLRNAARHASAEHVDVRLRDAGSDVVLEVEDDGVGFDPAAVGGPAQEGHFGLRMLPDLARQAGATLQVAAAPGAGTRWRLAVAKQ
jgi:signal transduction histidine kinase